MNIEFYQKLEEEFNVINPVSDRATYSSLLNYSDEKSNERQRWYRYKEGYSVELMKRIIKDYNRNSNGIILDPFLGSGTTLLAANELKLKGLGFEVNPFSYFLSKCKIKNYSIVDIENFEKTYKEILSESFDNNVEFQYILPRLSISHKVFEKEVEQYIYFIKNKIDKINRQDVKDLMMIGWLSAIEAASNYRKAGNGLKLKKSNKNRITTYFQVNLLLNEIYTDILNDIQNNSTLFFSQIFNDSALNLERYIEPGTISGVIFSPPYANAFDYTEIYKLELWFGEFVKDYTDLKPLRENSLRSHLNGLKINGKVDPDLLSLVELDKLLEELNDKKLWDKKIPTMLKLYFSQMFHIINKIYVALENEGFCSIVVGNSSYGGVIFPTDLLLSKYAESIGFKVDKIEVDRYIITSSQQYLNTIEFKKYLRESVVCLVKTK